MCQCTCGTIEEYLILYNDIVGNIGNVGKVSKIDNVVKLLKREYNCAQFYRYGMLKNSIF